MSYLLITKCNDGGFIDICFDGNGFPLPYYNSSGFYWTTLLIDLFFWLLVSYIIYFSIFYIIKLLKFLIKKNNENQRLSKS